MNYSRENQDRKTKRKAMTYTVFILLFLFAGLFIGSSGSISKITDTVKELVSGDEEQTEKSADDLSKRKRA